MNIHETIAVPVTQKVATAAAAGGLGIAAYFGITSQELGMFIGLFIAFGGGVTAAMINFYFRQKAFPTLSRNMSSPGISTGAKRNAGKLFVRSAHWSSTAMIATIFKRLFRAVTAFVVVLVHDPVAAHQKITEVLGIRG
ncbi:MAG: hypothetical protein IPM06_21610 [Rhizobiales bacterium]|nr:hypothetical protein [Hyphomicrobiales bacterium]